MAKLNERKNDAGSGVVEKSSFDDRLYKGNYIYYAQIMPTISIYEVIELKVHTINEEDMYLTGCEMRGNKHTYLFNISEIGKNIFFDRNEALKKVKTAQKNNKNVTVSDEIYYEEY